ncbi:hypothetical protein [Bradyrhizobium lupini]|uniref:hypothetical protein n=1 Tax=Rhizobium lupini TaxID=136996 RepID=UPI0034C6B7CD
MHVIGISSGIKHGHHDGAAVLLRNGELIAAVERSAPRRQDGLRRRLHRRRRGAELQDEHGDRGRTVREASLRSAVPRDAGVALGAAMMK